MIEWSDTARRTLDEYCNRTRAGLAGSGADADEVIDDLRRHVEEEIRAARLTVVSEADIRRILARVGDPGTPVEPPVMKSSEVSPAPSHAEKKRPGYVLLFFAVVLPLGTLILEFVTGISAGILFDPFPTWIQFFAVALVPSVNLWVWLAGRARDARSAPLLGWLNALALGICVYYAILYLPTTPFAAIGLLIFGLGLVPLTPLIALVATALLRIEFRRRIGREKVRGAWGILAGCGILVLLQVPSALTYYGLARAASDDKQTRLRAVRLLRTFGDRDLLLRACYGQLSRQFDLDFVRTLAAARHNISADHARETYFRVTGKPFNAVPPPAMYTRLGRWTALENEFTWDDGLGGEEVAGRVKGLSLLSSRMDAIAEPAAALVYCEWTLEFKNISSQQREARAQIALPPGAVVSRLTLWINGEECEAAFGGRSQTRKAYQEIAVVRRHDPVLVTTCGPDRVLMQCFPVPPNGGVMKVRVGLTAPLMLEAADRGRFLWPYFIERNFGIAADFRHGLWIESPMPLTDGTNLVASTRSNSHPFAVHENFPESELSESSKSVLVHRAAEVTTVWCPGDAEGAIIRQTFGAVRTNAPARLVVVVDGSTGMERTVSEITDALAGLPGATEIAVMVAGDNVQSLIGNPQKLTPGVLEELKRGLRKANFAGGQDNLPALEQAWNLATIVENGAVLWVHLPQSVLLSPDAPLRQCMERSIRNTRLFEIQVRNGPDRVLEKLDGLMAVEHIVRGNSVQSGLTELFGLWTGKVRRMVAMRDRVSGAADAASGMRVGKHLERLWARDEALRLALERKREEAAQLAAAHQLVTPLTGAVVLETRQQFTEHGLKPADPATVPAVPEPQTAALMGMAFLLWTARRFLKRRGGRGA